MHGNPKGYVSHTLTWYRARLHAVVFFSAPGRSFTAPFRSLSSDFPITAQCSLVSDVAIARLPIDLPPSAASTSPLPHRGLAPV